MFKKKKKEEKEPNLKLSLAAAIFLVVLILFCLIDTIKDQVNGTSVVNIFMSIFMGGCVIRRKEPPPLFKKVKENGTKIIPLMVSPCGVFEDSWLSKYQATGSPQETPSECTDAEAERRLANLMRGLKELIK